MGGRVSEVGLDSMTVRVYPEAPFAEQMFMYVPCFPNVLFCAIVPISERWRDHLQCGRSGRAVTSILMKG